MRVASSRHQVRANWIRTEGFRLDAKPFLSGAAEAKQLLADLSVKKVALSSVTQGFEGGIFIGPQFSRNLVTNAQHGVEFLGSSAMLRADLDNLPLIRKSDAHSPDLACLQIQPGMTLISRSGTIGKTVYARRDMCEMWSSEHIMKVVPNPDKIPPGYLYAFLSSRFGVPLIVSGTYGSIVQSISAGQLEQLPVPRLGKKREQIVHDKIEEHSAAISKFRSLMQKATETLLDRASLTRFNDDSIWHNDGARLGWQVKLRDAESLRSLNFDPRAKAISDTISTGKYSELGSLCVPERFKGKCIFRRVDADPGMGSLLVGQRHAFHIRPSGRWISTRSIEDLGLKVPYGSTLIPSHGTLGEFELFCRAVFVTNETSAYAFSGDFFRCIPQPEKVPPGYLYAFMRSRPAFRLLRSISTGGKQQEQHRHMMWRLPVPRLPKTLEERIAKLVDEAAEAFDVGLRSESEAWELLERWIGGGANG